MTIIDLINASGGNAAFKRAVEAATGQEIHIKTIEGWKYGKRCPGYLVEALRIAIDMDK